MSERIRRVRVLIEREDGQVVGWEFAGDVTATMHNNGSWDRSTGQSKIDYGLNIRSSQPATRLGSGQPAISSEPILEGEVIK